MKAFIVKITTKGTNDAPEIYQERILARDYSEACGLLESSIDGFSYVILSINIEESGIRPFGYETRIKP